MSQAWRTDGWVFFFASKTVVTIVASLTLIQTVGGLYRLPLLNAARVSTLEGRNWTAAFAPPMWLMLCLAILLAGLALLLVWRLPKAPTVRLLALFSVLLASGYATIFTASSSPLFEVYLASISMLREWGFSSAWLRSGAHVLAAVERLMWLGAWPFAASVSVFFVRRVLDLRALQAVERSAVFALLQVAWGWIMSFSPMTIFGEIVSYTLVLFGCVVFFLVRRREPWTARAILILSTVLLLLQVWTIDVMASNTVAWRVFYLLPMILVASRLAGAAPAWLLLPPSIPAIAVASSSEMVQFGMEATYLWVAACMVVIVTIIAKHFKGLAAKEQRQALWFMSGWLAATLSAFIWFVITDVGGIAGCTQEHVSSLCLMYRYKEWWLFLPMPILLLSFVTALMYSGPIDSAVFFRRTVLYGSVLLTAIFILGAVEALLSGFVSRGLPGGTPPVVAAGLMAVLLNPIKRISGRGVDALMTWLAAAGKTESLR